MIEASRKSAPLRRVRTGEAQVFSGGCEPRPPWLRSLPHHPGGRGDSAVRLFEQDVREKRRIAAGAHHKKRRGRGCTLPSDCLTPTQLRRLNGNVRTYRLDQPLRYEAVLALPEDLRREYLVRLRDGYRADADMLSEMLAVSRQRTEELLERCGIAPGAPEEGDRERFRGFCGKGAL